MKVFTTSQTKELDEYTVKNEPISSLELMERAANLFCDALMNEIKPSAIDKVAVFAGPGNNGGDALAIARILAGKSYKVEVYLFNPKDSLSKDCLSNKERILQNPQIKFTEVKGSFAPPKLEGNDIVIDGLFGSGLNAPLSGGFAAVVKYINQSDACVFSIDVPSGLFGEDNANNNPETIIQAYRTYTFQYPKISFFLKENYPFTGNWKVLDIGIHPEAIEQIPSSTFYTEERDVTVMYRRRNKFSHKGDFGHALLIAGSYGKIGAARLSAGACLRTGVGLLTCYVPNCGYEIMQASVPEAMVETDANEYHISTVPDTDPYKAIGIGPGIGKDPETVQALENLLEKSKCPLVIDADALNIISDEKNLLTEIPPKSILTPHPKEFDRLAGASANSFERLEKARELSARINCYIILKGAYTSVISPKGKTFFNSTGNPGMATGGSGDVLTGMLVSLMAQAYSPLESAVMGVYLHGLSGDIASSIYSEEAMTSGDIIESIGKAWKDLEVLK